MNKSVKAVVLACAFTLGASVAWAKLPPPPPAPPLDEKGKAAAEEKKAKAAAAAAKDKAEQAAVEDKAVKNFQANMKKAGKPIPKPTPIVAAATPAQLMPGPGASKGVETGKPGAAAAQANKGAVDARGHEKGAMTPAGNTPPKGTDTPTDAKKK